MKIKSLQLKHFKRFTGLTLQDIPDNTKLVLLIGSNGSGKSSVFDAFELVSDMIHRTPANSPYSFNFSGGKDYTYYHKRPNLLELNIIFSDNSTIQCLFNSTVGGIMAFSKKFFPTLFYGRSAVRYLPRITRASIGQSIDILKDVDKPQYLIDEDKRFENDIDLLIVEVVEKIFKGINTESNQQLLEIRFFLNKINDAFPRIFGTGNGTKLLFKSFVPPAEGNPSRLIFQKGMSELDYHLLSAGEKEVVNLLFNLFVRNRVYGDTIYFMDEIDSHLNTKLQAALLKEITENWIPANCQLWTASHSLGFIQYAKESDRAVIFDFDDYDFDQPKILTPEAKDNPDLYEIAVNKEVLPSLFKDYTIFFVENKDRNYYSSISVPHILFVQANNKKAVYHKTKNGEFYGIIDRDYLTDDDIKEIEKQFAKLKVLRLYSIENYLYHPNNLEEYLSLKELPYDKEGYKQNIAREKNLVVDEIRRKLAIIRTSYPFFEEPEYNGKANQKRFRNESENLVQVEELEKYLNSSDFDVFYKVFSMKDYATQLKERQNINKSELSKTKWFSEQIANILTNSK
ncbi:MAG TPA: AAA family ATPase [Puia sp.]|nr:AAA family ATPase [Puia sp.]